MMDEKLVAVLVASGLLLGSAAEGDDVDRQHSVVIGASEYLAAGADAIRAGRYDDGIRLTRIGLERDSRSIRDRAAGFANLCAAHVAKEEPDRAIPYCTESIELYAGNWRAYSNRSHAYFMKGMFAEAETDNDAAAAISPDAPHVRMIRGLLNERNLRPEITMKEHP